MDKKKKTKIVSCSVKDDLYNDIHELSYETGIKVSELNRRALKKFVDCGDEDALVMANLVPLIQVINEMESELPKKEYKKIMQYAGNIMKVKGGK